jgi:hypothetical protein
VQQGVQAQYSYSSSSYASQQVAAPPSAASASYGQPQQAYSQQAYSQQTYVQQQPTAASVQGGYASTATYGAPVAAAQPSAQQQQQVAWSQQASVQGAQQADHSQGTYGRTSTGVTSLPATGGASVNSSSQYGGQYGAVYPSQSASQQLLGASGRVVTAADDYQAQTVASRGSAAYGGPQDSRATIASGASYVVGGAPSGSVSGVYGASDTSKYGEAPKYAESGKYGDLAKYGDNAKYGGTSSTADYAGKGSDYGVATSPSTFGQKPAADPYGANYGLKSSEYAVPDRGQYAQTQSAYGQADTRDDTARRYQDAHAAAAAAQQRQVSHNPGSLHPFICLPLLSPTQQHSCIPLAASCGLMVLTTCLLVTLYFMCGSSSNSSSSNNNNNSFSFRNSKRSRYILVLFLSVPQKFSSSSILFIFLLFLFDDHLIRLKFSHL